MKHRNRRIPFLCLLMVLSLMAGILPAAADGMAVLGTVTVTNSTAVNVRSGPDTSYPIIEKAQPGAIYECTGTANTGWYQILLDDGRTGYISNKLSSFMPNAQLPTQQPQGGVQLPVFYKDVYGTLLNTTYVYLMTGSTLVSPDPTKVIGGYSLIGPQNVVVSVGANLRPMPSSVTFLYARSQIPTPTPVVTQAPLQGVNVPIYYMLNTGGYLRTTYQTLYPGVTTIYANNSLVGPGYQLVSQGAVNVSVNAYGQATPATVSFTYALSATPTPQVNVSIPVYYRDDANTLITTDYVNLRFGNNTVRPNNSKVPAGYTLYGINSQNVSVDAYGNANPGSVTFTYRKPLPPVSVNVPIIYRDHLGNDRNTSTVTAWSNQQNRVSANDSLAPAGYVLISPRTVAVSVSQAGVANPAQVVFTYQDPSTITTPQMLPAFVKTKPNSGNFPVYTGPGAHYYRVGNATLGGGTIRVYGQEDGWVLIGYGLSNGGYRIGFVDAAAIPGNVTIPSMILVRFPTTNKSTSIFVDDPIVTKNQELKKRFEGGGHPFTVLAYISDFFAYVEVDNFEGSGKPARGFVSKRSLGL